MNLAAAWFNAGRAWQAAATGKTRSRYARKAEREKYSTYARVILSAIARSRYECGTRNYRALFPWIEGFQGWQEVLIGKRRFSEPEAGYRISLETGGSASVMQSQVGRD